MDHDDLAAAGTAAGAPADADVADILASEVRRFVATAAAHGRPVTWADLTAFGVTSPDVPIDVACAVAGELAAAGVALPYLATVGLAAPLLRADGPRAAPGFATVAIDLSPAAAPPDVLAEPRAGGDEREVWVAGVRDRVLGLTGAEMVLVPAHLEGECAVVAVPTTASGVEVSADDADAPSGAGLGTLRLWAACGRVVLRGSRASAGLAAAVTRARCLLAAEDLGIAHRALDLSVEHAGRRVQFGTPIGAFQAIAHPIAEVYADIVLGDALLARAIAAASIGTIDEARAGTLTAGMQARTAALTACETAIQTMGAAGFCADHPVARLYRQALANNRWAGHPAVYYRALGEALLAG